jgi:excisionase family DNA binding protein
VRDVARKLSVSVWTVRRWIHDGKLHALRLPSGQYRIGADALEPRAVPRGT